MNIQKFLESSRINDITIRGEYYTLTRSDDNKVCSIGGRLYYYDACGDQQNEVKNGFVYMGSGTIHSVKGAPYRSERVFHFWRYNDRTLIEARTTE